jgi:hypothetical protein
LFPSLKLAALASQKIDGNVYQVRLHYFGGLGKEEHLQNQPDLSVVNVIRRFFTAIFINPENAPIDDCVRRARSLYITVRTKTPVKTGPGKSDRSTDAGATMEYEESIIACINFALLENCHGFYINWLATSNEHVSAKRYGHDMAFLTAGLSWQRNSLALFLIRTVNIAVISHHRVMETISHNFNIVLQARTASEEVSARFYQAVGFEEGGSVESTRDLINKVYVGFDEELKMAEQSRTDYIHFIWNEEDIVIFKNVTGRIGKNKSLSRPLNQLFPQLQDPPLGKDEKRSPFKPDFSFPFLFKRNHFMLLATNLECLYLPFHNGADMTNYISPNTAVVGNACTDIEEKNRKKMASAAWLDDRCMDFFVRW